MITPVVPLPGPAGLAFVDRTYDRQFEVFRRDVEITRDVSAFLERAGTFRTAADFVQDTRVLRVALGAFGLEDDLPKRAFIRKVLEEGTLEPDAFANRLADPAWRNFAEAVGLEGLGNRLEVASKREELVERYRTRQFERAVGDVDVNIRLALNFRREAAEIAQSDSVDTAGWFRIMGSRPLRSVIEGAFGLPDAFGQLDIDQQRDELERISRGRFGEESPRIFTDPEVVEDVVNRFLVRAQIDAGPTPFTPGFTALTILQSSSLGPQGQAGLFASNFL